MKAKYNVFVSYRRSGGEYTARIIRDRLVELGYDVFYDVESLRSGYFNEKLYSVIDECNDFIVVLSPNALDRCVNEDDWVRKEVQWALAKGKNVVPVMMRDFVFPEVLPASMEQLRWCNGLEANTQFFDAFIERLQTFLVSKPSLWVRVCQKELFRIISTVVLILLMVLAGVWGIMSMSNPSDHVFPRTDAEKNLTQEVIYSISSQLSQFDVLIGTYQGALQAARRYVSSGSSDTSNMQEQFILTENALRTMDINSVMPSEALLDRVADSKLSTAELQAMHNSLQSFRTDCLNHLEFIKQVVSPDYYPTNAERKLEILDYYEMLLEEEKKCFAAATNQMLLPVTEQESLDAFWHEILPAFTHIPLQAANWSSDYVALESVLKESDIRQREINSMIASLVGDSRVALDVSVQSRLQYYLEQGYTKLRAEKMLQYEHMDLEALREEEIQKHLSGGFSQEDAEKKADSLMRLLEIQHIIRIEYSARTGDDAETLWNKMMTLLIFDLYEEARECVDFYAVTVKNQDAYAVQYVPAVLKFIEQMENGGFRYGCMVTGYGEENSHPVLKPGDVVVALNDTPCKNHHQYFQLKQNLTQNSYTVTVLRSTDAGYIQQLQLELTMDMPQEVLNTLTNEE